MAERKLLVLNKSSWQIELLVFDSNTWNHLNGLQTNDGY